MNISDYSQYYEKIDPDIINRDMTVKNLIEWYFSGCGLCEKTIKEERSVAEKLIFPVMGDSKVTDLNFMRIELEIGALHETVSMHKRRTMARILNKSLNLAQFFDIVPLNCLDQLRYPKRYMQIIKPLKYREIMKLFSLVKDSRFRFLVYFLTLMPIRVTDIYRLRHSDWVKEKDMLIIENRTIVLPPTISKILNSQEALQKKFQEKNPDKWTNSEDLIFTDEYGQGIPTARIAALLHKAADVMNYKGNLTSKVLHDTAVAFLLDSGTDIKTVQYIMGFKSENKYLLHLNKVGAIHTREDLNTKFNSHMEFLINEAKEFEKECLKKYPMI